MMTAQQIAEQIIECFKRGNKVICFGNGGSLADCSHWAAEFNGIGPVIALNDPAKITSIGNDYGFKGIFSLQLIDSAMDGDLLIGLSSSGKSENILHAFSVMKNTHTTIDFPRKGKNTQEVQNYQYKLLHEIYRLVKKYYENT